MKVNFEIDWGNVVAYILFTVFYVTVVGGLGAIVWELDQMRTDTEPQRVEVNHVFPTQEPQQQRPPFQRKSV